MLRCFDDGNVVHVDGSVDPVRDKEVVELELQIKDLETVESRLAKCVKAAAAGDKDAKKLAALLTRYRDALREGRSCRSVELINEEEATLAHDLLLLTNKPVLYVCNVDDASAAGGNVAKNGASLTTVCRAVCRQAEIDPASVRLVEGEGSALPAQDKDEVRSIAAVYAEGKRPTAGTVALGSVKGLIGHTGPASGAAGLIKAALSLYQRVIPPSQDAGRPNAQLKLGETPFYLNLSPRPWIHNDQGFPRRAAVTALTFDGYAACLLLEQFRGAR